MPSYANPLYANGVPTYSNEVGALADVFKALAPNPLRDLQIQGYASNARLHQLQGDVINDSRTSRGAAADKYERGDYRGAGIDLMRGADPEIVKGMGGFNEALYASGAAQGIQTSPMVQATLAMGNGRAYGNTQLGFGADQDRQTREANQKNDTERYSIGVRSADSRYGSDQSLRGVMAGVGEDTRWHNMQGAENIRNNDMTNSRGMAVLSEDARDHDQQSRDRQFTSNNSLAGTVFTSNNTLAGTKYTADRKQESDRFDTLNDQRKSTPGGAVMDPSKFDDALIQTLPGSTQDDKGWLVNSSIAPADLAEVRTRAAAYFRQDPRDPYGAIQRANAEVFGQAPSITPEVDNTWPAANTPPQVATLPTAQRPPLPNLAQQFVAPPPAAPMPVPGAGPAAAPPADATLAKAAATAKVPGANRQGIVQKLMSLGYTAQQIQQAGI